MVWIGCIFDNAYGHIQTQASPIMHATVRMTNMLSKLYVAVFVATLAGELNLKSPI